MRGEVYSILRRVCGLLPVLSLLACSEELGSSGSSLKVGLLLPFTGSSAAAGQNYEFAAQMVAEQVNAAGGVFEGTAGRIEFITDDTHGDLDRSLEAVAAMIDAGVKAVIGPESSEVALAIRPVLEESGIVLLSPVISSGTQPDVGIGNAWYRFGPSVKVTGRAIAYDAIDQGARRLALLVSDDDYHHAMGDEVADRFVREGGAVAVNISLPLRDLTFARQISEMFLSEFDAVALIAPPKTAGQVVNEVAFLADGKTFQYFLPPSLETEVFLQNTLVHAIEGARGVMPAISDFDETFRSDFLSQTGNEPLAGAFYYHDAMMVLSLALATAYRFEILERSGRRTLVPLAEPSSDLSYEHLMWSIRHVSERNGTRIGWNELEEGLDILSDESLSANERRVFYHGLTGTMIQADNGQRDAARTIVWAVRGGEILRLSDAQEPVE